MCFYNQKRFACWDWAWASFGCQCIFEHRTGETCGIKLINATEDVNQICHLCKQIERKVRRKKTELSRLERWKREGVQAR